MLIFAYNDYRVKHGTALDFGSVECNRGRQQLASPAGGVESRRNQRECRRGTLPLQLVHRLEQRDVGSQRRQGAKQEGMIALARAASSPACPDSRR